MVLKIRFDDGRTQYIDLGSNFFITDQCAADFEMKLTAAVGKDSDHRKDCHTIIEYGERKMEPLYKGHIQWIYSNDGQLFMNLTKE